MLQIAQVRVKGNGSEVKANLLFDSGSDKSYISSSFVRKTDPRFVGGRTWFRWLCLVTPRLKTQK